MRRFSLAVALLWASSCLADQAALTWTYPTQNVDGSALVNLAEFRVYRRCDAAPLAVLATVSASTPAPIGGEESGYVDATPAGSVCWYSVSARNAIGEESVRTGEVSKAFAPEAPGAVTATFTWQIQELPAVAKSLVGEDFDDIQADGTTLTLTYPTVAAGDFAVIALSFYNAGGDRTVSTAPSGFTGLLGPVGVDGTGTGALTTEGWVWYKELTGAESGNISIVLSSSDVYAGATLAVYRGDGDLTYKASSLGTLARGSSSDAAATSAGVDAAVGDLIVMPTMLSDPPGTTNSNPGGLGLIAEGNTATNTAWIHAGEASSAGATGTKTWDFSNTRDWLTYQFLVEDAGAGGGGVGATAGQAAESDTAQAIARSKSKAIGIVSESDAAQAIARGKARAAAQALESDAAQAVAKAKARAASQAAETDSARTITPSGAPVGATVTQAAETDSARTFTPAKAKAIGQAAELDLVQTILRVKARAVGQALEGDSARPISLPGSIGGTLSQAIESDLARSVGKAKAKAIAQALETDAGRAIAAMRAYAVGRASETDAAIAVAAIGKALALGVATEQDIARAFTVSGGAPVDFYYLREALEMAAASIIAALANTTVTVDVGGAGETSGVVAIQQERSFDPGLPGLRMASTSTEFLLEKKTAPASLKQGTLIRDETSSETYRVRRLNYNRGGIVTVEIERV